MHDYAERRQRVAGKLREEGLGACLFQDAEGRRDPSIRYLTGQPGDALLFISAGGRSTLVAWDVNLAASMASVDEILPYTDFRRLPIEAMLGVLPRLGVDKGARVEIPSVTAYPTYVSFVEGLPDYDLICRENGMGDFLLELRSVKDAAEIDLYRRAALITDELAAEIEAAVRSGRLATEMDVALFIEREARLRGCEGTGFETLAAGPSRSFGIHAFPPYGAGAFAGRGLSILDCGVMLEGYTTDITMSFIRPPIDARAERMIALVEEAYATCVAMCAPGVATRDIALRADAIFEAAGFAMPHALGHGVGLEAHEAPAVRSREDNTAVLRAGQIITIEPGLYDPG
ncbi:MAG: M24 family metallopeptidase, partial [Spirochaetota bacterium]